MIGGDRYVVRPANGPDHFLVYDRYADAIVFGAEELTRSSAIIVARRLNDAYRQFRRGAE